MPLEQQTVTPAATVPQEPAAEPVKEPELQQPKTYSDVEFKSFQRATDRTINKLRAELAEAKAQGASVSEVLERQERLEEMVAGLADAQGGDGANMKRLQELRQARQPQKRGDPVGRSFMDKINAMADEVGADLEAPEFRTTKGLFLGGEYADAYEEAKTVISKMKSKSQQAESVSDIEKRIEAKLRKELGLDSVDTGIAAGTPGKRIYTQEEIADFDFYKKNKVDILLAREEGRIK